MSITIDFEALLPQQRDRVPPLLARPVGDARSGRRSSSSRATSTTVRPVRAERVEPLVNAGEHELPLLEQPMVADNDRWPPTRPFGAAAVERRDTVGRRRRDAGCGRVPTIAWAIGWSERCSIDAASATTSPADTPLSGTTSTISGMPRVSVPVLSNATQRTVPVRSRCAPPLISTPLRAALVSAATIDTGVEMTSAHGHETTSSTSAR